MKIYFCGKENCEPGHFFGPAVRPHYLIHFVVSGQGRYRTDEKLYMVNEGEAFLICPEDITYYEADQKSPWSYAWIAFDGSEAEKLLEERCFTTGHLVSRVMAEKRDFIRQMLWEMTDKFDRENYDETELMGYFYLIMSCLELSENRKTHSYDISYLEKALTYIRHNYSYSISIQDITRHVGIDRTYLYRIFMQYKKRSPKQYLTQFRLLAAKEMLCNTPYSITEIALSSGFHDASSFCKAFTRAEQISPQKFRKSL